MSDYSIYILIDPNTGQVRYVGKARNTKLRFLAHIRESLSKSTEKAKWIRSLLEAGRLPVIETIETIDESQVNQREKYWINVYEQMGSTLVNQKWNHNYINPRRGRKRNIGPLNRRYDLSEKAIYQLTDLVEESNESPSRLIDIAIELLWESKFNTKEDGEMRSQQAEQVHSKTGTHYDPWQKAKVKADGREVWIIRQNGDGKNTWYYTDENEALSPVEIEFL